jgi:hypothetical protein
MTAPTDGPSYQDQLASIAQLSNEELAGLETQIAAAFQAADEADDMDGMTAAADAKDQVEAEAQKRGVTLNDPDMDGDNDESTSPVDNPDAALDIAASADAPAATAVEEPPAPEGDETPAEPAEGDTPEDAPAEPGTPDVDNPAEATAEADNKEEAKVDTPSVPEDRQPQPVPVAASNVVVAGADVPHVSAGMQFADRAQFSQAMIDKINALRGARGDGEQVLIASVKSPDPSDDRMLVAGDMEGNVEKIAEVVGRDADHVKALVASGGYCAPLEPRYDVFGIGVTERPVRGALPGFRAQRGGIRFITPPKLSGLTGSVGIWTAATDAAPGGATKNKLIVACGAEQTVSISAVTMELQFGNFMARGYPEMVARNVDLGLIAQARLAEQTLLTAMDTLATSTISTISASAGTARDWLNQLGGYSALYRSRNRMDAEAPLRVVAPAWVRDAVRADVALSMSPTSDDVLGEADSQIQQWLAARNINVAWHLDDSTFIGAPTSSNPLAATFKWRLFAEGTFLFLDGGTLDIGVVRDSTLVGTNDYIQFTENFEALAMVGVEAWTFTSTSAITGYVGGQLKVGT